MMFFDGYIGAPPTSTVISATAGESTASPSAARLIAAANAASRTVNMQFLLQTWCRRATGGEETWRRPLVLRCTPRRKLTFWFDKEVLPRKYGFPMKLRIPTKLGFKNPKHIGEIGNEFNGGWLGTHGY